MISLLFIALLIEVLSFIAIRDHYSKRSGIIFYSISAIHFGLTVLMWFYIFMAIIYTGYPDEPSHINDQLILTGLLSAVLIPRSIFSTVHFAGKLIRIKRGGHIRWLTEAGIIFSALIFLIIGYGSLFGRFNFRTEEVTVRIKGLNPYT